MYFSFTYEAHIVNYICTVVNIVIDSRERSLLSMICCTCVAMSKYGVHMQYTCKKSQLESLHSSVHMEQISAPTLQWAYSVHTYALHMY